MSRWVGPEGHTRRSAQRSAIRTCLDHGLQAHRSQADFHIDTTISGDSPATPSSCATPKNGAAAPVKEKLRGSPVRLPLSQERSARTAYVT